MSINGKSRAEEATLIHTPPDTRTEAKTPRTCASRQLSLMSVVLTRAIRIKFGVDEEVWRGARPDELVGTEYYGTQAIGASDARLSLTF